MAAALITFTAPRSMGADDATAWLHRRAKVLRSAEPVEQVTLRELRPSGRDSVWLVHVVLSSDNDAGWEPLLEDLVSDLRRLGMRPTVVVDERSREAPMARTDL